MRVVSVFCMSAFYLPGYKSGGPVRTISALTQHLHKEVEFNILTADRDLLDEHPYPGIIVNEWNDLHYSRVFFASPSKSFVNSFIKCFKETPHDILYLNSFFDFKFTLIPLIARRLGLIPKSVTILAPRGEFSAGALEIKKRKKKLYIFLTKLLGLYKNIIWHASSEYEASDIKRVMNFSLKGQMPDIHIACDLTEPLNSMVTEDISNKFSPENPLKICFLSRISPKKNLAFALRILKKLKGEVIFDIYGPIEDSTYWRMCKDLISDMVPNVSINYCGAVENSKVRLVFSKYDLFFFPTRGENFGHVIAESMLAGTPVLLSDTTPWRNLEAIGVGWDLPIDNEQLFIDAIEETRNKTPEEYNQWRKNVHFYAKNKLQDSEAINDNRLLFLSYLDNTINK